MTPCHVIRTNECVSQKMLLVCRGDIILGDIGIVEEKKIETTIVYWCDQ